MDSLAEIIEFRRVSPEELKKFEGKFEIKSEVRVGKVKSDDEFEYLAWIPRQAWTFHGWGQTEEEAIKELISCIEIVTETFPTLDFNDIICRNRGGS